MNQFGKILKFELKGYLKNKVFVGITVFLMVAITVVMFIPNIVAAFQSDDADTDVPADLPVMLVYAEDGNLANTVKTYFGTAFANYAVQIAAGSVEDIKEDIVSGRADCAFVMHSAASYTYYVNNLSMYDTNTAVADSVLQEVYRLTEMVKNGLTPEQAG